MTLATVTARRRTTAGGPPRAPRRALPPLGAVAALAPFIAFLAVFLLWPMAAVLWHSVTPDGHLGTSTLARALSGPYRSSFVNSFILSGASALIGGVIGLVLALAVRDLRRPAWIRPTADAFSSVASQLGGVPLAFAFIAAIGTQGLITKALSTVGIDVRSVFSLSSLAGITLVYLYFQIPMMYLVVAPAVAGLRSSWREAAELLGAGPVRYWLTIAGPILAPSVLGGMVLLFINSFSAYATAYVLSSDTSLVPLQIRFVLQGNVITGEQDLGYALVTWTIVLMAVGLIVMQLLQRRAARWTQS
ncbi:MAG: ABC transporter permease subunit [Cellulomonas sp.]|nr:ABC transporter permease subunit [Cellulomonas sp.]